MPDLFLSYCRDDRFTMAILRDNLRKLGFNVWIDEEHLTVGTPDWVQAIDEAIRRVDAMVVILTPEAKRSKWINKEISRAQRCGKPIFPVLADGDELSAIPLTLEGVQYADIRGRSDYEAGFRNLIDDLATSLDLPVEDFSMDLTTDRPQVQVNVYGHVEGDVIAIGRDVFGNVNVAGGNIEMARYRPSSNYEPLSKSHQKTWMWIGGGIGVAILAVGVYLLVKAGGGGMLPAVAGATPTDPPTDLPTVEPTEPPTATIEPTDEPTAEPTDTAVPTATPIPTPTDTPEPTLTEAERARFLAESGTVAGNAEWTPYIESFDGVEMALVPAGCFMMGNDGGETDEFPEHKVCFEKPFWIDVTEVTNLHYGSIGCEASSSGSYQPRNCVDLLKVQTHCDKRGGRLPTEAEWEYAARGPDGWIYPWGDAFIAENVVSGDSGQNYIWVVGSRPGGASWVGALDLSGNVWEWVSDRYDEFYYSYSPEVNPQGAEIGTNYVIRGGSFKDTYYSGGLRADSRSYFDPVDNASNIGFRCAADY